MDGEKMLELAQRFLDAWNTGDPDTVAACYTQDVIYRDPSTNGTINGIADLRRFLVKLLAAWEMTWSLREAYLFEGGEGCAALWRATAKKRGGDTTVEFDGMDLILFEGELIRRNEVNFDRMALAPLMGGA